jgi:hypothetical protein
LRNINSWAQIEPQHNSSISQVTDRLDQRQGELKARGHARRDLLKEDEESGSSAAKWWDKLKKNTLYPVVK